MIAKAGIGVKSKSRSSKRRITPQISARIAQASSGYDMRLHVFPFAGRWTVTMEGRDRALRIFSAKAEALRFARTKIVNAQKAFIAVHTEDGSVAEIIS